MMKHEIRTCNKCGVLQTVKVKKPNHILHIILSVCTFGFWLVIYLAAAFESWAAPTPKCHGCKAKMK